MATEAASLGCCSAPIVWHRQCQLYAGDHERIAPIDPTISKRWSNLVKRESPNRPRSPHFPEMGEERPMHSTVSPVAGKQLMCTLRTRSGLAILCITEYCYAQVGDCHSVAATPSDRLSCYLREYNLFNRFEMNANKRHQ